MNKVVELDLAWSETFAVGHERIDTQHKRLFDLYGLVVDAYSSDQGGQVIGAAIADLVAYTRVHFRDEQSFMERINYAELEQHLTLHNELLDQVDGFVINLKAGKPELTYDLLLFLRNWLTDHILQEDMKLRTA